MPTLADLEKAYQEAAHQAIGANMMRLELLLDVSPAARDRARAYHQQLEAKAATALAEWKAATQVVATPEALQAAAEVSEQQPALFVVVAQHEGSNALAA